LRLAFTPDALDLVNRESLKRLTLPLPFKITVKDSDLFFQIDSVDLEKENRYWTRFLPAASGARADGNFCTEWKFVLSDFRLWAQRVRVELDEPDPWLLVEQGSMLLGSIPTETYTDRLSEHDLHSVHEFVGQIREFLISEVAPNQQQLALIDERLGHLEEAAKTQDRKAFAYTAVGVVVAIATALTLSPEVGHKLFVLTSELLKTLFMRLLT
jgi:hypothetical protein